MHTQSPWIESEQPSFAPLDKNIEVDVAIVGGGITGLTAGLLLQRGGKSVAIIDNGQIATGETGYTTAHLTQVLDTRYHQIISDFGLDKALLAASSQSAAIMQIEKLIYDYNIQCDFERLPGYLFSVNGSDTAEILKETEAMQKVGIAAEKVDAAPLPFKTGAAIRVNNQAQFHPRRYLLSLAMAFTRLGGHIYEQTRATKVTDGTPCEVETRGGKITAKDVIVAANIPVNNWVFLHTKIAAYRSYALCAKLKTPIATGLFWDTLDPYHYIRSYRSEKDGDFLIVGGEDHKTGTQTDTNECFHRLERYARERFDIDTIPYYWSGQIIEPCDGLAYIGHNSMSKHVYVSTGYSGNGMTYGTLGAMILSDLIFGQTNEYAELYSATRLHVLASAENYVSENKDFVEYFIGDWMSSNDGHSMEDVRAGQGKVVSVDGHKVAAYRDEQGSLHTLSAVCPHMGCVVHWNNAESTWDCPCHGSRFDAKGKVANGPALSDLKPVNISEKKAVVTAK